MNMSTFITSMLDCRAQLYQKSDDYRLIVFPLLVRTLLPLTLLALSGSYCFLFPGCFVLLLAHYHISIHPNVPWVHHPLVCNAHLTIFFHASLSCALLFKIYI